MKNLDALTIFSRVAEKMSFTRAAESLGTQKGRVSAVIRELEKEVGVALLHRTTRSVMLTEDGKIFYSRAQDLLAEAQELKYLFAEQDTMLKGKLRVDMPTELARRMIVPALPQLIAKHPALELELSCTDRRVDLVQEGFDCVIRLGPVFDETLIARNLGQLRMINVASPVYLHRYGIPYSVGDLITQGHQMVHYTRQFGSRLSGWEYPEGDGYTSIALPGIMQVNSVQTYHEAGLAGIGLIQAGHWALKHHLEQGSLVEILPDMRPPPLTISLVVAHRRNLSHRVRAFTSWVETVIAPWLEERKKSF